MQSFWRGATLATVGMCLAAVAAAQGPAKDKDAARPAGVKPGEAAPEFELKGADGKAYKLADYKDKVVVLEWWNQDCPFSNFQSGVGPKAKALAEKYRDQGVVWLAIDSSNYQTADKNAKYAATHKIPYPVLMDTDGKVGRLYGATNTPHMFVIQKGKVIYAGGFSTHPSEAKKNAEYRGYVEEALDAILAGKEVPVASTPAWGCPVKYKAAEK